MAFLAIFRGKDVGGYQELEVLTSSMNDMIITSTCGIIKTILRVFDLKNREDDIAFGAQHGAECLLSILCLTLHGLSYSAS